MKYTYDDPELWQYLSDYPDYTISSWGRLWNVRYGKQIIGYSFSPDYPVKVKVKDINGVIRTKSLHRLVAEAFYTGYEPDVQVSFINGDKYDCHVLNLRFVRREVGQFKGGFETLMARRLISSTEGMFSSVIEAARYMDVTRSEIYDVIERRRRHIKGVVFWWEWIEVEPDEYQPIFRPDGRALQSKLW